MSNDIKTTTTPSNPVLKAATVATLATNVATAVDPHAEAKAAVLSFTNGRRDFTKAVKLAYKTGDWVGIQSGLDTLAAHHSENKAVVRSMAAIMTEHGDKTISARNDTFSIVAKAAKRGGGKSIDAQLAALAKAVKAVNEGRAMLADCGIANADRVDDEIVAALKGRREMRIPKAETVKRVERFEFMDEVELMEGGD